MNIFYLDESPYWAARYHNDKHVVKMVLETAQILCTALYLNGYNDSRLYRPTHTGHPCVQWAAANQANFLWTGRLGRSLALQYKERYKREHKCEGLINLCYDSFKHIKAGEFTNPPQIMPEKYRQENPVFAYREYYKYEKVFGYSRSQVPSFMQ